MNRTTNNMSGFSLTEMSIVLVAIGLITAAILSGRSMIEDARIRSIISEISNHRVSYNNFLSRYDQVAGDFNNAEGFWGAANTDNGDNDGKIEFLTGTTYETFRAWQHISLSKMTEGEYLGTATTGIPAVGVDVPGSKVSGGGAYFFEYGVMGLTTYNVLMLGKPVATAAAPVLVAGLLTPSQAHSVDSKIDDGAPTAGIVRGADGNGSTAETCVDDNDTTPTPTSDDIYKISVSGYDCVIGVRMYQQ